MPTDAALAIIVSGSVGFSGVVASIITPIMNSRSNRRQAREAIRREAYAHFIGTASRTFSSCLMHRSAGCPDVPERQAKIEQGMNELFEAFGALAMAGGSVLGSESLNVVKSLAAYHLASAPGMTEQQGFPTLDAYNADLAKLMQKLSVDVGGKIIKPKKRRKISSRRAPDTPTD